MNQFTKIDTIDNLDVYLIPIDLISEMDHGYEGCKTSDRYFSSYENWLDKAPPIVLYKSPKTSMLLICDGWHRWKLALMHNLKSIRAVIFNSLEECRSTENIPW